MAGSFHPRDVLAVGSVTASFVFKVKYTTQKRYIVDVCHNSHLMVDVQE